MKLIFLFLEISISFYSLTQSVYGSLSGTYTFIPQSIHQPATFIVNTHNQISFPWFYREEKYNFQQAYKIDVSFGHLVNSNFGYELTFGYLKPNNINENDEIFQRQFKGNFFQTDVKILANIPLEHFDFYTKFGLNIAIGKLNYNQIMYASTSKEMVLNHCCPIKTQESPNWGLHPSKNVGFFEFFN